MPAVNSQMVYNYAGDAKPVTIGEGKEAMQLVPHSVFTEAMENAEMAMMQKVSQDNAESYRLNSLINGQGLTAIDPATGGVAELIAEVNKMNSILTQLVQLGKSNATTDT